MPDLDRIAEELEAIAAKLRELELQPEVKLHLPEELDTEEFRAFLRKPYLVLPKGKDEYYVVVPRFVDFHVGWLEKQTESYNVYVINRFTAWFTPLPEELERLFEKPPSATVRDGYLLTDDTDYFWKKFRRFLSRREGEGKIKVKKGYEFELIASLIDHGILPFRHQPRSEPPLDTLAHF